MAGCRVKSGCPIGFLNKKRESKKTDYENAAPASRSFKGSGPVKDVDPNIRAKKQSDRGQSKEEKGVGEGKSAF